MNLARHPLREMNAELRQETALTKDAEKRRQEEKRETEPVVAELEERNREMKGESSSPADKKTNLRRATKLYLRRESGIALNAEQEEEELEPKEGDVLRRSSDSRGAWFRDWSARRKAWCQL